MKRNKATATALTVVTGFAALIASGTASAAFTAYQIRNAPTINVGGSQTEFVIASSGQKGGYGSSDIDGATLGDINSLQISRLDDRTRFTPGSGPYVAPYLNFWITDVTGTKFAVIANEPSDGNFQPLYNNGYNLSFADLSNKAAKIFEVTDKSWLPNAGLGTFTFADFAGYKIQAPTVAQLGAGWAGLGTGAPRESGTNVAYGVNWVFGDTLTNYVSGQDGYIVGNDASISAVPVPAAAWLFGSSLGLLQLVRRRRV